MAAVDSTKSFWMAFFSSLSHSEQTGWIFSWDNNVFGSDIESVPQSTVVDADWAISVDANGGGGGGGIIISITIILLI